MGRPPKVTKVIEVDEYQDKSVISGKGNADTPMERVEMFCAKNGMKVGDYIKRYGKPEPVKKAKHKTIQESREARLEAIRNAQTKPQRE